MSKEGLPGNFLGASTLLYVHMYCAPVRWLESAIQEKFMEFISKLSEAAKRSKVLNLKLCYKCLFFPTHRSDVTRPALTVRL
jgi:hypothetical protein